MKKSRTVTQATRANIVANASVMILKKGSASVGMREVMAASHLTQGGFYRHFASNGELVAEASEHPQQATTQVLNVLHAEFSKNT